MKKLIFIFSILLIFSFKIDIENFQKLKLNGFDYQLAKSISCKSAPEFMSMTSANKIPLAFFTEETSDTNDILTTEKILKKDLDNYLNDQLKKTDTISDLYKFLVSENKDSYQSIKDHVRQIKTFVSNKKRYMYLNLFCKYTTIKEDEDLQLKYWVVADDGYKCFWQMIIDLTDKKIICAQHNGMA